MDSLIKEPACSPSSASDQSRPWRDRSSLSPEEVELLKSRRLVLLLDLDLTLVCSVQSSSGVFGKGTHIQVFEDEVIKTRLRPGFRWFLKTMKQFFHLHIITSASEPYAQHMRQLLDGNEEFFEEPLFSREGEITTKFLYKNTRRFFTAGDCLIVKVDDTPETWDLAPNLLRVPQYQALHDESVLRGIVAETRVEDLAEQEEHFQNLAQELRAQKPEFSAQTFKTWSQAITDTLHSVRGAAVSGRGGAVLCGRGGAGRGEAAIAAGSIRQQSWPCRQPSGQAALPAARAVAMDDTQTHGTSPPAPLTTQQAGAGDHLWVGDGSPSHLEKEPSPEKKARLSTSKRRSPGHQTDTKRMKYRYWGGDADEYLALIGLHLQRLHSFYFRVYDDVTCRIPDMNILMFFIKSQVLKGTVIHVQVGPGQRLAVMRLARCLGAELAERLEAGRTTHVLVDGKEALTTRRRYLLKSARRCGVQVVLAFWLRDCLVWLERVDEQRYLLSNVPALVHPGAASTLATW